MVDIFIILKNAVVVVGGSATLTNSGKIENKDGPTFNSITLLGNGATLNLKDKGGKVIGVTLQALETR